MYLVGEALTGKGSEIAHIDLVIGEKNGPIGQAFVNGLTNTSSGHTPLIAVIRPNLPAKPFTLLIPKVTVKTMEQAEIIFGPAQAAVAKAVADALEDGIIPVDKAEEWVIICSVFIHPDAKDYRKIYHYNYGATRLALRRAMTGYPSVEKILYDKDRATHPVMGFRVPRLWMPPYLQIALDVPDVEKTVKIIDALPQSDRIVLEVGTPLIKKYGTKVISQLREHVEDTFIVADLKTLDVGQVEVDVAFDDTADGVVASGLASTETLNKFIYEAARLGIYSFIDMMEVSSPLDKLRSLKERPDVVILHRAIDVGVAGEAIWNIVKDVKGMFKDGKKLLVGVAGGINPENAADVIKTGADIIIVGRYITQSKDVEKSTREFLRFIGLDMDLYRVHIE